MTTANVTLARLAQIAHEALGAAPETVTPATRWEDLGADSLDRIEMTAAVEEEFSIEISTNDSIAMFEDTVLTTLAHIETIQRRAPGSRHASTEIGA